MKYIPSLLLSVASGVAAAPSAKVHAPHTSNGAAVFNPNPALTDAVSQACFQFTFDDPSWSFTRQNPWGSGSSTFGSLPNGQLCVPTNDGAGGAMFIGPGSSPGPGSTKLECFFPTSGTANCDISLVDGYSLSVECNPSSGGTPIGGSVDLWTQGNGCPEEQDPNCINTNGYGASQGDVPQFFQPAVNSGNNYCIWVNCGQDYYFPVTDTLNCHVSGTAK